METLLGGFTLMPHPDTPPGAVSNIFASLALETAGQWKVNFAVEAPPGQLLLPPAAKPQRTDGLWRTTCFELFVLDPETGAYLEFNMSPSGCWAAYAFDGYREGMRELPISSIGITTSDPAQFDLAMRARFLERGMPEAEVEALMQASRPAEPVAGPYVLIAFAEDESVAFPRDCRVGISAVIEKTDGTKSYWALAHPEGKPDFHHPACFAGTLEPPQT